MSVSCNMRINEQLIMYTLHTLPWYWKALILAYDFLKCWQQGASTARSLRDVYETTTHVFMCQVLLSLVLLGPSLVLSVQDRTKTNEFVSEIILLLSSYMLLIHGIGTGVVSAENACFCLQFCSCYFFFCYFIGISQNSKLLLGKTIVQPCSVVAMCVFPVMFSHVPRDCMHLSPYVLLFLFSGEVSACACSVLSYVIVYVESIVDSVYVHFM